PSPIYALSLHDALPIWQTTVTNEVYNSIPSAKSYAGLMLLIPAVSMSSGTSADIQMVPGMVVFGGSGGRTNEGRLQVDGLNTGRSEEHTSELQSLAYLV